MVVKLYYNYVVLMTETQLVQVGRQALLMQNLLAILCRMKLSLAYIPNCASRFHLSVLCAGEFEWNVGITGNVAGGFVLCFALSRPC